MSTECPFSYGAHDGDSACERCGTVATHALFWHEGGPRILREEPVCRDCMQVALRPYQEPMSDEGDGFRLDFAATEGP